MTSSKSKEYSIKFGREPIRVALSFKERKTLKISVHPDKTVTVDAPKEKKLQAVLARVKERAPWIIKQRAYFERFQPLLTQRQYISGESYYYLGRQYRLKVLKESEKEKRDRGADRQGGDEHREGKRQKNPRQAERGEMGGFVESVRGQGDAI